MRRLILSLGWVLVIIYLVPFVVYGVGSMVAGLKAPEGASPAGFRISVLEHISAGRVVARTEGKAAGETLARRSAGAFAWREQKVLSLAGGGGRLVAEIDYPAVLRADLSPGQRAGSELKLRGASVAEFAGGRIVRLSDDA
jgi:hypothetical protein